MMSLSGRGGTKENGSQLKRSRKGGQAKDLLNEAVLHVDISMEGLVIIHNPPAFDQKPVALWKK